MHILLVTTYYEPDEGAAAIRLTRLAKLLHQRGHQITVLTALPHYPQGHIPREYRRKWSVVENRNGVRVIRSWLWATPSPRISRKFLSQMSFMFTAALRGLTLPRPDIILIEAQPVFTNLAGVFLSKIKRRPYVLNVSDLWPDHLLSVGALTESHPVYRIARKIVDATYRGAARIVTLSPAWARIITSQIGRSDTIETLYNAVDLDRFRPGLGSDLFREKYGLGDARLITFIGTLATQYDLEWMLATARQFENVTDVRFVFIGSGSQGQLLDSYLQQENPPNVTWLKWVDHAEIPQAWAASSLNFWVMRSQDLYRGTIPAKLYEALASGTPVAAVMEGLGAEMLAASGGGIMADYAEPDRFVAAIRQVLESPELREQMSHSGRQYAEQHFDPDRVAAAYERVLLMALE